MIRPTAIILSAAALLGGIVAHTATSASASYAPSSLSLPTHMVGAFNIDQPGDVPSASADGLQQAFHYDYHPPSSTISQAYEQYNMQDINGAISQYMWDYECHRVHTVVSPPPGVWDFCSTDLYPSMNYSNLIASVTNYLQVVQSDPVIKGYWVLDDWPWWDATARNVLIAIHNLIQQYTPGRPAICGFGALIFPGGDEWNSQLANNFSPQGCDEIGFYVYADTSSSPTSAGNYDWTMSALLPKMENAFRNLGWNPAQTPFIGIPQAFGGRYTSGPYEVVPTGASILAQSRAFCQAGASSLVFYSWTVSDFSSGQTPENNSDMKLGTQQAIAACQQTWGTSSSSLPPATATPLPTAVATSTPVPYSTATPLPTAPPLSTATPVPARRGWPTATPTSTPAKVPSPTSTPVPTPSLVTPLRTSPVSFEAENSSASGNIEVDSYPSASNGRYIQFTSATPAAGYCPRLSPGNGVATEQINVPASSRYEVWSRFTGKGTAPNTYLLQVDNSCPVLVGDQANVGTDAWAWVNYQNGNPASTLWVSLAAGVHTVRMIGYKAGLDLDRVIFTPDFSCQPVGTGDNCATGVTQSAQPWSHSPGLSTSAAFPSSPTDNAGPRS